MVRIGARTFTSAQAQAVFGAVSLAALLLYTWTHTGSLLARYVEPDVIGYICACGVELAIVSLSLRIGDLRRSGQAAGLFVAVLVAVLVVSAFANVAEGYAAMYGGKVLTVASLTHLDPLQALFGLSSTGLISLIVFALSDIIGSDVRRAARKAEQVSGKVDTSAVSTPGAVDSLAAKVRARRTVKRTSVQPPAPVVDTPAASGVQSIAVTPVRVDTVDSADGKLSTTARRARLAELYAEDDSRSQRELARLLAVSATTVGDDLRALRLNGYREHA